MKTNQHNSLDDIVFENKNKAYGAYYNRMTAGFDLMKSLLITILGIGILTLILSFTVKDEIETPTPPDRVVTFDPTVLPPKDDKKDDVKKTDEPIKKFKTVKSDETDATPTPTNDPEKQTPMKDNEDISKVISGDENIEGDENTGIKTPKGGGEEGGTGDDNENGGGTEEPIKEDNKIYFAREVSEMAIFPGCEKFAGNNTKLTDCLSEQLQRELGNQLDFETTAQRQGINEAVAKIQFVIDKSGKIVEVKTINGGNVELSKESKEALERISKRMVQKGKYIKPAKFDDGTPVNLIFTIPVKFVSN